MRLEVSPHDAVVMTGQPVVLTVEVTNTSSVIESYGVRALGLDPAWVNAEPATMALFPGATGFATLVISLPATFPAGEHVITVQGFVERNERQYLLVDVALHVTEALTVDAELQPLVVQAARLARFGLRVTNKGNRRFTIEPVAPDTGDDGTEVTFTPARVLLEPGEQAMVQVTAKGKRPWFGPPLPRQLAISVGGVAAPVEVTGTILQRARIARGLMALVGLLAAASVFAVVLTSVFSDVVSASKVQDSLLKAAIDGDAAAKRLSGSPTRIAGHVTVTGTKAGVSGTTVQVYASDNPVVAVATAASGDDGAYEVRNLAPGSYRLRFIAAGFREVWYPGALGFETANPTTAFLPNAWRSSSVSRWYPTTSR